MERPLLKWWRAPFWLLALATGAKSFADNPILGSRPRWTGVRPPFRPDVPCVSQRAPDLRAATGPAPQQRRVSSFDPGALTDIIDLLRVPAR